MEAPVALSNVEGNGDMMVNSQSVELQETGDLMMTNTRWYGFGSIDGMT